MPRNNMINMRADDDEVALMQVAADAAGVKLATWVRDAALQAASPAEPAPPPSSETDPMLAFYRGSVWAWPSTTNSVKRRVGSGGGSAGALGGASNPSWRRRGSRTAPWLTRCSMEGHRRH